MFFYHGATVLVGQVLLIIEDSRSHSDILHSVELPWKGDQTVAETSTCQHTTLTTDRHPAPGVFRTHDLSRRAAADPRLRPRGHRARRLYMFSGAKKVKLSLYEFEN